MPQYSKRFENFGTLSTQCFECFEEAPSPPTYLHHTRVTVPNILEQSLVFPPDPECLNWCLIFGFQAL